MENQGKRPFGMDDYGWFQPQSIRGFSGVAVSRCANPPANAGVRRYGASPLAGMPNEIGKERKPVPGMVLEVECEDLLSGHRSQDRLVHHA